MTAGQKAQISVTPSSFLFLLPNQCQAQRSAENEGEGQPVGWFWNGPMAKYDSFTFPWCAYILLCSLPLLRANPVF